MSIELGDFVRPINSKPGLRLDSVWYVVCTEGALKLEPFNASAKGFHAVAWRGLRFSPCNFEKVIPVRDGWSAEPVETDWMASNDAAVREFLSQPIAERSPRYSPSFQNLPKTQTSTVASAEAYLTAATNAAKEFQGLLRDARDLEAARKADLREAKLAQAKAEKEAAAKAKVAEAKRQLAARLHADRCLADATLELIGEVSRLNSGGPEREAPPGIAMHVAQLQPLAKSYGYRIVKPSMVALVVKL